MVAEEVVVVDSGAVHIGDLDGEDAEALEADLVMVLVSVMAMALAMAMASVMAMASAMAVLTVMTDIFINSTIP